MVQTSSTPRRRGIRTQTFINLVLFISLILFIGVRVDTYGHFQMQTYDTIFTPWHAAFYAGLLGAILLAGSAGIFRFLPEGFFITFVGGMFLFFSLPGDMGWHTLFGFEQNAEAALSPSHWGLIIGLVLFCAGPLWAKWLYGSETELTLRENIEVVLSAGFALSMVGAFTFYANPLANSWVASPVPVLQRTDLFWPTQQGAAAFVIGSAVMVGLTLAMRERWRLRFGSITALYLILTIMLSTMWNEYRSFVPALVGGLFADWLADRLKLEESNPRNGLWFAFLVPLVMWVTLFLTLSLTGGIYVRIHGWGGMILLGSVSGLLVGALYYARDLLLARRKSEPA